MLSKWRSWHHGINKVEKVAMHRFVVLGDTQFLGQIEWLRFGLLWLMIASICLCVMGFTVQTWQNGAASDGDTWEPKEHCVRWQSRFFLTDSMRLSLNYFGDLFIVVVSLWVTDAADSDVLICQSASASSSSPVKEVTAQQAASNWLRSAESDSDTSSPAAHNAFAVCTFFTQWQPLVFVVCAHA